MVCRSRFAVCKNAHGNALRHAKLIKTWVNGAAAFAWVRFVSGAAAIFTGNVDFGAACSSIGRSGGVNAVIG